MTPSDWAAVLGAVVALASVAISYGMSRQKINDMGVRMDKQDERLENHESKMEKIATALAEVTSTHGAVGEQIRSFAAQQQSGHQLLASQIAALDRLFTQRMDALVTELRTRATRSRRAAGERDES